MKPFKFLLLSLSLVAVLSACNFPSRSSLPTQKADQSPDGSIATTTLPVNTMQIKLTTITPLSSAPLETTSPILTLIPPNTPVWLVYNYTCEFATGGGTMTMNLTWTDRSNSEEGYNVYRDEKVIATLAPNSTFYVDVAYVAAGNTLQYSVEAYNAAWRFSTSTITRGCQ